MKKIMMIEGMSCEHCKAFVEKTLKGIDGVSDAVVNLDSKNAEITLSRDVADDVLMKAVEEADYEPVSISAVQH